MKFHRSQSYIDNKAMMPIYGTIVMVVFFFAIAVWAYSDEYWGGLFIATGFFTFAMIMSIPAWKQRKVWQNQGASQEIEVTDTSLIERDADGECIIPLEDIKSITMQNGRKGVGSLLIKMVSGETATIEGYENMEQLALEADELIYESKSFRKKNLQR